MQVIKNWSAFQKVASVILLILYFVGWLAIGFLYAKKAEQKLELQVGTFKNSGIIPKVADMASPVSGVLYTKEEEEKWQKLLPLAVVIENHTDARPQSGLNRAEVVYETLAEGGITRFLAVFLAETSRLGPVRSNRPYFLDWVSEYAAGYAHVGGSPLAQSLVKTYKIKDLDQFFLGAPTYERVTNRFAPHNVYTTTERLRKAASSRGYKGPVKIQSWAFTQMEALPSRRPKGFTLDLGFLGAYGYDVRWTYDRKSNGYLRSNGGVIHKDVITNKRLSAKNIIVQYVQISPEPSGHSRILQKTIGSGKAFVFKDGKAYAATWKKKSRTSRTVFLDKKGKEIPLNRGRIWVEVVPTASYVKYTTKK